jgi:hypothetical protein
MERRLVEFRLREFLFAAFRFEQPRCEGFRRNAF